MVTVEEGTLEGGFGSAVLEAANAAGLDTRHVVRLGLPDRFVEHGERGELLAELGLDVDGICATVRTALRREGAGDERRGGDATAQRRARRFAASARRLRSSHVAASRGLAMRIFVLGNADRPGVREEAERLLPFLREHAEIVAVDLRPGARPEPACRPT